MTTHATLKSDGRCRVTAGKFEMDFVKNEKGEIRCIAKWNVDGGRGSVFVPVNMFKEARMKACAIFAEIARRTEEKVPKQRKKTTIGKQLSLI